MIQRTARSGFTLLELMLSLALIVVVTSLIGSLVTLYVRSFSDRSENIKQKQLAASLLTMMADDIRSVVTAQPYDKSALESMMGASGTSAPSSGGSGSGGIGSGGTGSGGTGSGGSGSGGSGSGGTGSGGTGTGGTGSGGTRSSGGTGSKGGSGAGTGTGSSGGSQSASSTSSGTGSNATTDSSTSVILPPGIYGTKYQLMVDVSRIPRSNEFNVQNNPMGMPTDVPGDVKTVTYMMQAASPMGVQDSLRQVATAVDESIASNGGMIRQAIDRNVYSFAQLAGNTTSIGGGDMVASEVVALEFSYFDGMQWTYEWDSSQQGLPWLIQISLALQDPAAAKKNPLEGGVNLQTMSVAQQQEYGVKIFQLAVAIPGAALQAATGTQSTAAGMGAMGL